MSRTIRTIPVLLLVVSLGTLFAARRAQTTPLWAARTGDKCGQCHFDPNGGGPRNEYGFMFARNRHRLEPEGETSRWKDLDLTNKIGDRMPVYIGLNQRFMMLANTSTKSDSLDRFGFFNMESGIYFTFQPHERLTLVYARDAFAQGASSGVQQKEAFGMLSGLRWDGYLKLGRFRNPFGLRMDDHSVATRNAFLEFTTDPIRPDRFLPYDPRNPDMGIEYGMEKGPIYGRAAFTNGESNPLRGQFAETKAMKLGYNAPWYQGGLSFYDSYQKEPGGADPKRATRWGYYGLGHRGPIALIGEIAAGTDQAAAPAGGPVSGPKKNLLAAFGEIDWAVNRAWNLRFRYDHFNFDRSGDSDVRATNTHQRYALEGEWVPVPFMELRWTVRRIDHKDNARYGYDDETQVYTQAHFSY